MYKYALFFMLISYSCLKTLAQTSTPIITQWQNNIPPSPTAAGLGDYANIDYGVKSFAGLADINIPLFKAEIKNVKIPISLNYNPRGIKVNEMGSWVGLGWSLFAGGVITRTIKSQADDKKISSAIANGYVNSQIIDSIKNITDEDTYANARRIGNIYNKSSSNWADAKYTNGDLEPDVYTFNFNGRSGKFYFGEDHQVKLIPYQDLDITYEIDSNNKLASFTIIDELGIKYKFNDKEKSSLNIYQSVFPTVSSTPGSTFPLAQDYSSSWYITTITLPFSQDVVNFTYADEIFSQIYNYAPVAYRNCPDGDCYASPLKNHNYPSYSANITTANIVGKRLTTIESNNLKIDFIATNTRLDLAATKRLDAIKVYAKTNNTSTTKYTFIKGYSLSYTYNAGDKNMNAGGPGNPGNNDYSQRLLLKKVQEIDVQSAVLNNGYNFEYNEQYTMPNRFSPEQDLWGYYNHNGSLNMLPRLYIYPQDFLSDQTISIFKRTSFSGPELILPGANRDVNPTYIALGALTKITYPTYGYTSFEYEPNSFYYFARNIQGGGIRLKKTVTYDGTNHANDITKDFIYTQSEDPTRSSGRLLSLPNFFYIENTHPYDDPTHAVPNLIDVNNYAVTSLEYYNKFLTRLLEPRYCLGGNDGINVGYREVTEIQTNNGKINYIFSLPGVIGQNQDTGEDCDPSIDGYCDGLFKPNQSHFCKDFDFYFFSQTMGHTADYTAAPDLKGMNFNYFYQYPFVESTNYDWNRGLLLFKTQYKQGGQPVRKDAYEYKLYYPKGHTAPTYVTGLKIAKTENWKLDHFYLHNGGTVSNDGSPYTDMYVFSKYKMITEVAKVISKISTTLYENGSGPVETVENYKSESIYHPSSTSKEYTDSQGRSWEEQYIYVKDIGVIPSTTVQPAKGFRLLQTNKMNPLVWTRKLSVNGSSKFYVSGSVIYFDLFGTAVLPSIQKTLELSDRAPYESFGDVILYNSINVDSRYKTAAQLQGYDAKQNLLQYKIGDNSTITNIWGYNDQYLIGTAKNATINDFAYTSFEFKEDKGGWTFNNAFEEDNIDNPNSGALYAATGRRVYSLGNTVTNIVKTGLDNTKKYIITCRYYNGIPQVVANQVIQKSNSTGANMNYCEFEISNSTSVTIQSGTSVIDELRLYPKGAQVTTYTYDPMVGVTSITDEKNQTVYYEYDNFNRLIFVKDKNKNILKSYNYNYKP